MANVVPVGTIFHVSGSYWKVIGPKQSPYNYYPVVKCTRLGKEFTKTNSFQDTAVERWYTKGLCWKGEYNNGIKADTTNAARGIRRRRIQHLEATIAEMQKELDGLLREEFKDVGD